MVVAAATAMTAAACSSQAPDDVARRAKAAPAVPFSFAVTPTDKEAKVPVSAEVGMKVSGGSVENVSVTDSGGHAVDGSLREDGSSWVPSKPLHYNENYTAKVTAIGARLHRETKTVTFTTMGKPSQSGVTTLGMTSTSQEDYGVAMPIAVGFEHAVPENMRAEVQRRLFVTSDPPQPGAWHWFSGTAVEFRPANYWQPGTKLTVRSALEGLPLGDGFFGDQDRTATGTISKDVVEMQVINKTKQLKMYKNGTLVKSMPISLGKPSTPSSTGHMVIMEKASRTTFDTRGDPQGGYVVDVDWAMRLTAGGEYIHSAPWSVGDQGHTNVSHGCVNVAPDNAEWLFKQAHVGDPVTVSGTEVTLTPGNGWTGWDMGWDEWVKGSAIPVSPSVAQATAYDPAKSSLPVAEAPAKPTPAPVTPGPGTPGQATPAPATPTPAPSHS